MKDGLKVALAVIAGYYLGRHHKLRLAMVLALAILAARLKGEGAAGALLEQVPKILGGAAPTSARSPSAYAATCWTSARRRPCAPPAARSTT